MINYNENTGNVVKSANFCLTGGKVYECKILGYWIDFVNEKITYNVQFLGKENSVEEEDIKFYDTMRDYRLCCKKDGEKFYPINLVNNFSKISSCYDRVFIFDGSQALQMDKRALAGRVYYDVNAEEDPKFNGMTYATAEDVMNYNEVIVTKQDGTTEKMGGTLTPLLLNEKQLAIKAEFENILKKMSDEHMLLVRDDYSYFIINKPENAKIEYAEDADDDAISIKYHTQHTVKDIFDYDACDGLSITFNN